MGKRKDGLVQDPVTGLWVPPGTPTIRGHKIVREGHRHPTVIDAEKERLAREKAIRAARKRNEERDYDNPWGVCKERIPPFLNPRFKAAQLAKKQHTEIDGEEDYD